MNPIARMMKRYIKTPLKYALPLLFIGSLVLVATTGCVTSNTTQNSSGGGTGAVGVAVKVNYVTNLNKNNFDIGDPYYFKLTTSDGTVYQYSSSSYLGNNALNGVSHTNPGEKVTGQVAFEIPQNAKATTLVYDDYVNRVTTNL